MAGYVGLIIVFLIVAALAVPLWAIARVARMERKPEIFTDGGMLVVKAWQDRKVYDLSNIDHFLVVTTFYFSASGYMCKKEFFLVDSMGEKRLFHSRDPVSMASGSYEDFISRLERTTGKEVMLCEYIEDLSGQIWTTTEYAKLKFEPRDEPM